MHKRFVLLGLIGMFCLACGGETTTPREVPLSSPEDPIRFWDQQRKGANYFNEIPTSAWFQSADEANIRLVRMTFEKWKGEGRDFLMGDGDQYQGLVEADWQLLKQYLDVANSRNIKVVITPISLPGDRWRQSNGNQNDGRLWKEEAFRPAALQYWTDLAARLKGHPAVVGYNLVNEPHPEVYHGKFDFWEQGFVPKATRQS